MISTEHHKQTHEAQCRLIDMIMTAFDSIIEKLTKVKNESFENLEYLKKDLENQIEEYKNLKDRIYKNIDPG